MTEPRPATLSPDPSTARRMGWTTRRYVLALSVIALLAIAAFTSFQGLIAAHDRTLSVVNISGRQRMLSQRIALYVHRLASDDCIVPRALCVDQLRTSLDLFEASHAGLTLGGGPEDIPGPTSALVRSLYFDGAPSLDARVREYAAAVRTVLEAPPGTLTPDHPAVRHVLREGPGPLLEALDAVVLAYQHDGEAAMALLRRLEIAVLALTLLTLLLEALFIFRPMIGRLGSQFQALEAAGASLREANLTLERRVAERTEALTAAIAAAEKANWSKSHFLAAAGHDMLQPLEAAEMFAGLLEREATTPRAQALLQDLGRTQQSLRHLVRSVLDVSKLEAGVVTPVFGPVAVGPLLLGVAADFGPVAAAKELRLAVVPTALWVDSDAHLLERVLRNLISNALRYTTEGGVVIGCRRRGDHILIQVADSGEGIAPEDQERIFEAFVQVGTGTRDRSEGLGLGLSVVRGLGRLLGHPVHLWSQPGRGSVVSVECRRVSEGG
ncbi:MAG: hypothetical protein VR70_07270 [Rhodospirillaceae bacterium BRH_c57]|nr:MAG: hypothetical protein VR70_07270 [Rhodospirillaceae bacterium BRH_c57]